MRKPLVVSSVQVYSIQTCHITSQAATATSRLALARRQLIIIPHRHTLADAWKLWHWEAVPWVWRPEACQYQGSVRQTVQSKTKLKWKICEKTCSIRSLIEEARRFFFGRCLEYQMRSKGAEAGNSMNNKTKRKFIQLFYFRHDSRSHRSDNIKKRE